MSSDNKKYVVKKNTPIYGLPDKYSASICDMSSGTVVEEIRDIDGDEFICIIALRVFGDIIYGYLPKDILEEIPGKKTKKTKPNDSEK